MEIQTTSELADWLGSGRSLRGLRLQDLDLTSLHGELLRRTELTGLVVLGGRVPEDLLVHLQSHGAVVFPAAPDAPVNVYRAHLYTGAELYAGLDGGGYEATVDARAYAWGQDRRLAHDAYASLLRAIHDDSISDALDEWVVGRRVVGVMGGHAEPRGSGLYGAAARLGHALASAGLLVATGGGPGAMEAVNLGALARTPDDLEVALDRVRPVRSYAPSVDAWARTAMRALEDLGPHCRPVPHTTGPQGPEGGDAAPRSLGVPTWFYGHEPPNVFAEGIAKYFSNAVREDGLLARSNAGVVVLPGAAGTVQEVFQLATRLYYAHPGTSLPPLVMVGSDHWLETLPVWPLVRALARERGMAGAVHLVDEPEEAVVLLARSGAAGSPTVS